jgi:hypothetical protein
MRELPQHGDDAVEQRSTFETSSRVTYRQATASFTAARTSLALPAAVNSRARLFPGSE